jgi:hypothetical protein
MIPLNSDSNSPRGIYWLGIVAIGVAQILVLLALAAVVVRYLEWSSEAKQAEFMSATKPSASRSTQLPQPSPPIERVKAPRCYWKA